MEAGLAPWNKSRDSPRGTARAFNDIGFIRLGDTGVSSSLTWPRLDTHGHSSCMLAATVLRARVLASLSGSEARTLPSLVDL